ncbi:MAG: zinc-ribbon domain-containing protein [Candidatus Hodarchaeales archaeon]|jgi:hypothetical protein
MIHIINQIFFWFDLADSGGMMQGMNWSFFWPMMIGGMILWAVAVYWVYQDAESQGKDGFLWAVLVAFTMMMGLAVYLVVRFTDSNSAQSKSLEDSDPTYIKKGIFCSNCGSRNLPEAQFCSQCAALL